MIKINHLINLHDARFAAAENVDFISFALAKGNIKKISLTTYQDIIQWIAGTYLVVDFENDVSSLLDFLDNNIPFDFLQVHYSVSHLIPKEFINRSILYCDTINEAQKYLVDLWMVESPFDISHERHFQLINFNVKKQISKNYSLDSSFFFETYDLDYEKFINWNQKI